MDIGLNTTVAGVQTLLDNLVTDVYSSSCLEYLFDTTFRVEDRTCVPACYVS